MATPDEGSSRTVHWVGASQACARLGVKPATLYAYVSRGLVRSRPGADARSKLYSVEDLDELVRRAARRRDPDRKLRTALDWGAPVLDSSLTLIDARSFYYRGVDATRLALEATFEEVAALLWLDSRAAAEEIFAGVRVELPERARAFVVRLPGAHPAEPFLVALRFAAAADDTAYDQRPERAARCGARILATLVAAAAGPDAGGAEDLPSALAASWSPERPRVAELLRAALILCADHELNVSSFTARCIASAGASPYDAVCGGLSALRGFRHGGASDRMEELMASLGIHRRSSALPTRSAVRALLRRRLNAGEELPGFHHPLYPAGDPRWVTLRRMAEELLGSTPVLDAAATIAEEGEALLGDRPNVDLALAMISTELELAPGGAWTLFALGRTVGWIAHAIEEYARGSLIRPRARYVGPAP